MPEDRRSGDLLDLRAGDHVCWQFASEQDYGTTVADYAVDGFRRRERVLSLSSRPGGEQLLMALGDAGVAVDELVGRGALLVEDARATLAPNGRLDREHVLEQVRQAVAQALADGYDGLRLVTDVASAFAGGAAPDELVDFELRSGRTLQSSSLVTLCVYDRRAIPLDCLNRLCAVHAGCVHENRTPFWVLRADDGSFVVGGEVDLTCTGTWRSLLAALASEGADVTLDLGDLRFIDVAGLRELAEAAIALAVNDCVLTLRGLRPSLHRYLALLAFDGIASLRIA